MDQLKTGLKFLKEHGFWVVCGLVIVISLATWFKASSSLREQAQNNRQNLEQKFNVGYGITGVSNHPNQISNDAIDLEIQKRRLKVYQAWQDQESHQRDLLKWPAKLEQEHADEFKRVQQMRPIEKFVDQPISGGFLTIYREYVYQLVPQLAQRIRAQWQPTSTGRSQQLGAADPMELRPDSLVLWEQKNQADLWAQHFDWSRQPNGTPTPQQLLYAQEDLWVLEALMKVIATTNGDVVTRREAAIKTIHFIKLGKNVEGLTGKITTLKPAAGGQDPEPEVVRQMTTELHEEGQSQSQEDPAEGRYVDLKYQPLTAARLRQALQVREGNVSDLDDARLAVAKRMPVQMRLLIAQDSIDTFMIECSNSELPIEIRQVRINPDANLTQGQQDQSPLHAPTATGQPKISDETETDVTLEIYGIVSIYNPADPQMLNIQPDSNTTATTTTGEN